MLLLEDEDDLRFKIAGVCNKKKEGLKEFANENGIPFWTTERLGRITTFFSVSEKYRVPAGCLQFASTALYVRW